MSGAAVAISVCALLFTVAAFWWLNARSGRLRVVGEPRSFALNASGEDFQLTLPLAFWNEGPTPVAAINLELRSATKDIPPLVPFVATKNALTGNEGRQFATAVVLAGNEARLVCCDFITKMTGTQLAAGRDLDFVLRGLVKRAHRRAAWVDLLTFTLKITEKTVRNAGRWIPYDNFPDAE